MDSLERNGSAFLGLAIQQLNLTRQRTNAVGLLPNGAGVRGLVGATLGNVDEESAREALLEPRVLHLTLALKPARIR